MALGASTLAIACAREPLPDVCPVVEVGELVVSELRGDQSGSDAYGHYVEVYNASGRAIDLQGAVLRLVAANGDVTELFVRESVEVAPGGYAAIGPGFYDELPVWLDYAIGWDIGGGDPEQDVYPRDLLRYDSGFVELEACERVIDTVFHAAPLPSEGSLACGNGASPPRADDNDASDEGCWCIDAGAPEPGQPGPGVGLPGTPGGVNRCP